MKYVIASDLHGSAQYVAELTAAFHREGAALLILLGDLLYHGPRNDLPGQYDTKKTIALLNALSDRIVCVRGNCDAEVDQMVLDFPMTAEYSFLIEGERRVFLTHGHRFNPVEPPKLRRGDVMLSGHTHIPASFRSEDGIWFLNPGSVSIPKNGSPHSYMTMENGVFLWKTLSGEVYRELTAE